MTGGSRFSVERLYARRLGNFDRFRLGRGRRRYRDNQGSHLFKNTRSKHSTKRDRSTAQGQFEDNFSSIMRWSNRSDYIISCLLIFSSQENGLRNQRCIHSRQSLMSTILPSVPPATFSRVFLLYHFIYVLPVLMGAGRPLRAQNLLGNLGVLSVFLSSSNQPPMRNSKQAIRSSPRTE